MKNLLAIRMGVLLFGTAAVLFLAPASKAQSEISPDHFDGTDSWEVTAQSLHAAKHIRSGAKSHLHGQNQRAVGGSTFKLAAVRENSKAATQDATAVNQKRRAGVNDLSKKWGYREDGTREGTASWITSCPLLQSGVSSCKL